MTVKLDGTNGLLQNYDYQTPSTGFSYTFTSFNVALFNPSGTLATGTITMPASPVDGMTVTFTSTQDITALTVNANTGQSIVGGGSISIQANTSRTFIYRLSNTTWYPQTIAAPVDVQTFNSTATWTKPTGGQRMARIQVWGGGGGGGRSAFTSQAGGGGGGGYNEVTLPLSYLAATVTATVGTGGAGATVAGAGGVGGNSTFALATAWNGLSTVAGYGGGAGSNSQSSGSGGGPLGAGSTGAATSGAPQIISDGGNYPLGSNDGSGVAFGGIVHGGSGGCIANPGNSIWGGGGGGANGYVPSQSVFGGAGGLNAAGTAPGGGGGSSASANVNGSAGGAGRIVVTCW